MRRQLQEIANFGLNFCDIGYYMLLELVHVGNEGIDAAWPEDTAEDAAIPSDVWSRTT